MVRRLGDLPERRGECVEVIGHRVEIVRGDEAVPVSDIARGEGRGVEEATETLDGLPVRRFGELGEEGVAPDGFFTRAASGWMD